MEIKPHTIGRNSDEEKGTKTININGFDVKVLLSLNEKVIEHKPKVSDELEKTFLNALTEQAQDNPLIFKEVGTFEQDILKNAQKTARKELKTFQ